jgi:hypothetical protein
MEHAMEYSVCRLVYFEKFKLTSSPRHSDG